MSFSLSFSFPQMCLMFGDVKKLKNSNVFHTLKGSWLLLLIFWNTCALWSLIGLQLVPPMCGASPALQSDWES